MNLHFTLRQRPRPPDIYSHEYKQAPILRILSLLLMMVLIAVAGGTAIFVYARVSNTIGQVQSILVLQSELGVEPINFGRLEQVQAAWEAKHATTTLVISRDPFQTAPTPPPPSTELTTLKTN